MAAAALSLVGAIIGKTVLGYLLHCLGLAGSVTDSSFTGGDAGLIADTFVEAGVEIAFDNFVVLQPRTIFWPKFPA